MCGRAHRHLILQHTAVKVRQISLRSKKGKHTKILPLDFWVMYLKAPWSPRWRAGALLYKRMEISEIPYFQNQNQNQKTFNVPQTGKFVCHGSRILQKQKHITRTGFDHSKTKHKSKKGRNRHIYTFTWFPGASGCTMRSPCLCGSVSNFLTAKIHFLISVLNQRGTTSCSVSFPSCWTVLAWDSSPLQKSCRL